MVTVTLLLMRPAFSQEPNPDGASQPSPDVKQDSLRVNPLTGQVSASGVKYTPLTGKQRWKLYFKQNFWSVGAYFGPVFSSLVVDQAAGEPPQWGGGFEGYGRRLSSRMGTAIVQGTFQAPVAALLKEDTRYILSDQQKFSSRLKHAVLFSFLTYNSQGHTTLNIANLGGYYASSAVSTLWIPESHNTALYALADGSRQAGLGTLVNMIQEFWPEIRRSVFHHQ